MPKNKADWLADAKALGLDVTAKNTVAEIKAAVNEGSLEVVEEAPRRGVEVIDQSTPEAVIEVTETQQAAAELENQDPVAIGKKDAEKHAYMEKRREYLAEKAKEITSQ